jgi:hypothetical protein
MKTIDIHAHIISEETVRLMQKEAPKVGPRITAVDAENALFEVGGSGYRPFRAAASISSAVSRTASEVDMQGDRATILGGQAAAMLPAAGQARRAAAAR